MNKSLLVIGITIMIISIGLSGCNENRTIKNIDTDGDGFKDNADEFPNNSSEWKDSDKDGVGDNSDVFPFNSSEWKDTDSDGVGDNSDYFPYDNTSWAEIKIITISGENITQIIDEPDKSIILVVTGANSDVVVSENTTLIEINLSGMDNIIRVSINHTFTSNIDGVRNEIVYYDEKDPIILKAKPFINKIVTDDKELKSYANSIISDCNSGDGECKVNAIYRHIIETYNYVNNSLDINSIQTPQETIQKKEGDCEDLSILFCSLLENIGITTNLVLTENHVYSMACNVDPKGLWNHVELSLIRQVEMDWGENISQTYEETVPLAPAYVGYYGAGPGESFGDYIEYMNIDYKIDSENNQPLHIFIFYSFEDLELFSKGEEFRHKREWEKASIISIIESIQNIDRYVGLGLINEGTEVTNVTVDIDFYFHPSFYNYFGKENISKYMIGDSSCVILDPTLGDYGFPGFDSSIVGEKIAINPTTKEYSYLS